jgi:hypothetical protein
LLYLYRKKGKAFCFEANFFIARCFFGANIGLPMQYRIDVINGKLFILSKEHRVTRAKICRNPSCEDFSGAEMQLCQQKQQCS